LTLRDIDMRPHPLGIVYHPEWSAVRNRHAERVCNWLQRQAHEAEQKAAKAKRRRNDRPARRALGDLTKGLILLAAVIGMWWSTIELMGLLK